ncbi:N-acetylmuramoyl-L-alanine amidase family protein [Bacillus horti]|uniref:N-acetylmuramoyl-L-alanine amidase n=1 Tax=Caldalkalibacillus horti TaxID=77523 RepID=A0ABT9VWS1_9BACI|nr:N-acetylmuramoyl-L-alanine amidase [Bacillus horti]MDQ0165444.1 N-acetylmuramoyl-L-alanine amidase [Bacillus horti]
MTLTRKILIIFTTLITLTVSTLNPSTKANSTPTTPISEQSLYRFMPYDVVIDIGHGGIDGGTFHKTILEKDINLTIGLELYKELKKKHYLVGITRTHDYALSDDYHFSAIRSRHQRDLTQRKLIAEGLNPKLLISIHVNYSSSKKARGPMVIYQRRGNSYLIAALLQDNLNKLAQTKHSIVPSSTFFLLQSVDSPALIAEVGYISHPQERALLQQPAYQQQIAQAISNTIDQYFTLYPSIAN